MQVMSTASFEQLAMASPEYAMLSNRKRYPLVAALTFLEGVASGDLGHEGLILWIERYLVGTGWMPWPGRVHERLAGSVTLGDRAISDAEVRVMLLAARARIISVLRGFVARPSDERFLHAAIHGGRVQRDSRGMMTGWVPRPHIADRLSDVVLALFAADILGQREGYERSLQICERCDRVTFDPSGAALDCDCAS
jgi:hypothetical protein